MHSRGIIIENNTAVTLGKGEMIMLSAHNVSPLYCQKHRITAFKT